MEFFITSFKDLLKIDHNQIQIYIYIFIFQTFDYGPLFSIYKATDFRLR